jgi:methionyl aminopeptidase
MIEEGGDKAAFLGFTPKGSKRAYPAALCVSVNEEVVHGIPNEHPRVLAHGDLVTLDLGLIHKGLYTDMAISVLIPLSDDVKKIKNPEVYEEIMHTYNERSHLLETAKTALMAGIAAARGGSRTGDIGAAIENAVHEAGESINIIEELCGHGVGYGVHEDPYVPNFGKAGTGDLLRPGMVIAIEPILTLGAAGIILKNDGYTYVTADGASAVQVEHTVLITENGAEVLTKV